jgi:hypothetical protein
MKRVLQAYFIDGVLDPLLFIFSGSRTCQRPEHFFTGTAHRTYPFFRKVPKAGALGNLGSAIASIRVIDVSTIRRLALIHFLRLGHIFPRLNHF